MQTPQLQDEQKQKEHARPHRTQEVLQFLQETHRAQRNEVIRGEREQFVGATGRKEGHYPFPQGSAHGAEQSFVADQKRIGFVYRRRRAGGCYRLRADLGLRHGLCEAVSYHLGLKGIFVMDQKKAVSERHPDRAWYVVHTYSGYEKKVKATLDSKVAAQGLEDVIFDVVVPMRDESEFKDGKRRIVQKKIFPGYVLVDMIVNNNSWFVVRNTQGVTGFVGSEKDPIPLSDEEAKRILTELADGRATDNTLDFSINDNVRIIDGIFENRLAVVKGIDAEKQRLKVLVEDMPVDLDVSQVEKI